jgi:2-keto-4-pentenoate hydratase/2-oxohepta-3-ene-1,7-dioic acid hydratase in catechol pathway
VLGPTARRLDKREASAAIAGYSVLNDVTMRDFHHRTMLMILPLPRSTVPRATRSFFPVPRQTIKVARMSRM